MAQNNELAEMVTQINDKISSIQDMIDSTETNENANIRNHIDELKALLATYESADPTEETVADDINFALSKQSMTIEEREDLLNTKIRQIEMATERNSQTKNMLTVFIIINVVVLLVFVGLIVIKAKS
jgi:archaellum component FlaC